MIRRSLLATVVLALLVSGCAAAEEEEPMEGSAQAQSKLPACSGFTLGAGRVRVDGKTYSLIIDKTCRFSEGLGAVWAYGIDADERPFKEYSVESSRFPDEKAALDQAIAGRLKCPRTGEGGDVERVTKEVIPEVERGDAEGAIRKLKAILLAPWPSCS
jgi:hypothetical protein